MIRPPNNSWEVLGMPIKCWSTNDKWTDLSCWCACCLVVPRSNQNQTEKKITITFVGFWPFLEQQSQYLWTCETENLIFFLARLWNIIGYIIGSILKLNRGLFRFVSIPPRRDDPTTEIYIGSIFICYVIWSKVETNLFFNLHF